MPRKNRVICIQLDEPAPGKPSWPKHALILPQSWRARSKKKHLTLLDLYGQESDDSTRNQFVAKVADEICQALARQVPAPTDHPPRRPAFDPAAEVLCKGFDDHVRTGRIEPPHATLREEEGEPEALLPRLMEWATSDDAPNRIFALLGSFGAGKTTAAQLFAQHLIARRKTGPNAPFPIYLDFRRLLAAYGEGTHHPKTLAELILACLNPLEAPKLDIDSLLKLLQSQPAVIIFDGLDEIGTRVGVERAAALYRQLLEIVPDAARESDRLRGRADWAASPVRLLVTCRSHFFRSFVQQQSTLDGFDRQDALPKRRDDQCMATRYMALFTPAQIESFLVKTLGEEAGRAAFATLQRIPDLERLARKPIMTRYLAELAPALEQEARAGLKINVALVYRHLFQRAVEREGGKGLILNESDRQKLLEQLALEFCRRKSAALPVEALEQWFDAYVAAQPGLAPLLNARDHRAALHTELRNASLLIRAQDDAFSFVHSSFYDYFLACALWRALQDRAWPRLDVNREVSAETVAFVVDLAEISAEEKNLAQKLAEIFLAPAPVACRPIALTIAFAAQGRGHGFILPPGADMSDLDLRGMHISALLGISASDMRFCNADLRNAAFAKVQFHRCDFTGANSGRSNI